MLRHLRHPALAPVRPLTAALGSVVAVSTSEPDVVLTYDDGPQPGDTESVLDALASHGATATFFLLAGRAMQHPELARRIGDAGHEIALHGVDHRPLPQFPAAEVEERTRRGVDELQQLTGHAIRWMRPPYGRQTYATWRAVRRAGAEPVLWGATSRDSQVLAHDVRVRSALKVSAGSILLCHDGFAGPDDGVDDGPSPQVDRGALADAILHGLAERGLRGRSLADALLSGRPVREAWFSR